jgi:hypothetical protein
MNATAIQSKQEANMSIELFAQHLCALLSMRATSLVTAMSSRLTHDEHELDRLEAELGGLSSGYHKYLDVLGQIRAHERSLEKLKAVIGYGAAPMGVVLGYVQPECPDDLDAEKAGKRLRRSLELWEAVEQYLRFVPEAKIKDILEFMEMVKVNASRQSVEAAIKAHPKVFRAQKRKGEKFISLRCRLHQRRKTR